MDLYLTVHAVEGIEPGAYSYRPAAHALELLKRGDFRQEAAYLCLEQALGGMSSSTVFFFADLDALLETYGNRGYRLANLEGSVSAATTASAQMGDQLGDRVANLERSISAATIASAQAGESISTTAKPPTGRRSTRSAKDSAR